MASTGDEVGNASTPAEVAFLMERLLDEQEKVARLEMEVLQWRNAASLLSSVTSSDALYETNSDSVEKLEALRQALLQALQQVDEQLAVSTTAVEVDVSKAWCTEYRVIQVRLSQLRNDAIRFRSVRELEELYRSAIRIGHDADRILLVALDKLDKLTVHWTLLPPAPPDALASRGDDDTESLRLPSVCRTREWATQFRKALVEVVVALDLRSSEKALAEATRTKLRVLVMHEAALRWVLRKVRSDEVAARESQQQQQPSAGCAPVPSPQQPASTSGAGGHASRSHSPFRSSSPTAGNGGTSWASARSISPRPIPELKTIKLPRKATATLPPQSDRNGDLRSKSYTGGVTEVGAVPRSRSATGAKWIALPPRAPPPQHPQLSPQRQPQPTGQMSPAAVSQDLRRAPVEETDELSPLSTGSQPRISSPRSFSTPAVTSVLRHSVGMAPPLSSLKGTPTAESRTVLVLADVVDSVPRRVLVKSPSPKGRGPRSATVVAAERLPPPPPPADIAAGSHREPDADDSAWDAYVAAVSAPPLGSDALDAEEPTPEPYPFAQHQLPFRADDRTVVAATTQPSGSSVRRRQPQEPHVAVDVRADLSGSPRR